MYTHTKWKISLSDSAQRAPRVNYPRPRTLLLVDYPPSAAGGGAVVEPCDGSCRIRCDPERAILRKGQSAWVADGGVWVSELPLLLHRSARGDANELAERREGGPCGPCTS